MIFLLFDPLFRGPLFGSMLMCICAALTGAVVYLRKQLLLGEALSHATYPGIVVGGMLASALLAPTSNLAAPLALTCAFAFTLLALRLIRFVQSYAGIDADAALCFVLSFLLGIGVLLASVLQMQAPLWYKRVQSYLYGQVVTLSDAHIVLYAALSLGIVFFLVWRFREIELLSFDPVFAFSVGAGGRFAEGALALLLALATVVGIRSVGVVLMSGMLIAPVVAARQVTDRFASMLSVSAVIGAVAALFGNVISLYLAFPPGPLILLFAASISLVALLFAPRNGLVFRLYRRTVFHFECLSENIVKTMWKIEPDRAVDRSLVVMQTAIPVWIARFLFWRLARGGWLYRDGNGKIGLTKDGFDKAARIVRLHRLWEVYLSEYMGVSSKRVHRSAEEIEHILTADLENELMGLVGRRTHDPHEKPIPEARL